MLYECSLFSLVHSLTDGKYISTISDNSSQYITCMACLEGVTAVKKNRNAVMPSLDILIRLVTGGNMAELKVWDMMSSSVDPSETLR